MFSTPSNWFANSKRDQRFGSITLRIRVTNPHLCLPDGQLTRANRLVSPMHQRNLLSAERTLGLAEHRGAGVGAVADAPATGIAMRKSAVV